MAQKCLLRLTWALLLLAGAAATATPAPQITAFDPVKGSSGVRANPARLCLTFNQPMAKGATGSYSLTPVVPPGPVITTLVSDTSVEIGPDTRVCFVLRLAVDTNYTLTLDHGALVTQAQPAVQFPGMSTVSAWPFSTKRTDLQRAQDALLDPSAPAYSDDAEALSQLVQLRPAIVPSDGNVTATHKQLMARAAERLCGLPAVQGATEAGVATAAELLEAFIPGIVAPVSITNTSGAGASCLGYLSQGLEGLSAVLGLLGPATRTRVATVVDEVAQTAASQATADPTNSVALDVLRVRVPRAVHSLRQAVFNAQDAADVEPVVVEAQTFAFAVRRLPVPAGGPSLTVPLKLMVSQGTVTLPPGFGPPSAIGTNGNGVAFGMTVLRHSPNTSTELLYPTGNSSNNSSALRRPLSWLADVSVFDTTGAEGSVAGLPATSPIVLALRADAPDEPPSSPKHRIVPKLHYWNETTSHWSTDGLRGDNETTHLTKFMIFSFEELLPEVNVLAASDFANIAKVNPVIIMTLCEVWIGMVLLFAWTWYRDRQRYKYYKYLVDVGKLNALDRFMGRTPGMRYRKRHKVVRRVLLQHDWLKGYFAGYKTNFGTPQQVLVLLGLVNLTFLLNAIWNNRATGIANTIIQEVLIVMAESLTLIPAFFLLSFFFVRTDRRNTDILAISLEPAKEEKWRRSTDKDQDDEHELGQLTTEYTKADPSTSDPQPTGRIRSATLRAVEKVKDLKLPEWIAGPAEDWEEDPVVPLDDGVDSRLYVRPPPVKHTTVGIGSAFSAEPELDDGGLEPLSGTTEKPEEPTGTGTRADPYHGLELALSKAAPGSEIVMLPGLYPPLRVQSVSGEENRPIVIHPETQESVAFVGFDADEPVLYFHDCHHIVFSQVYVVHQLVCLHGIEIVLDERDPSPDRVTVTFSKCVLENVRQPCMYRGCPKPKGGDPTDNDPTAAQGRWQIHRPFFAHNDALLTTRRGNNQKSLPHWCLHVGYLLNLAHNAVCVTLLLGYVAKLGSGQAWHFFLASLGALVQDVLLNQPVKIFGATYLAAVANIEFLVLFFHKMSTFLP